MALGPAGLAPTRSAAQQDGPQPECVPPEPDAPFTVKLRLPLTLCGCAPATDFPQGRHLSCPVLSFLVEAVTSPAVRRARAQRHLHRRPGPVRNRGGGALRVWASPGRRVSAHHSRSGSCAPTPTAPAGALRLPVSRGGCDHSSSCARTTGLIWPVPAGARAPSARGLMGLMRLPGPGGPASRPGPFPQPGDSPLHYRCVPASLG